MNPTVDRVPNQEQEAVIRELDRNLILFASAGTGKTFTVARHVDRILEEGRAKPEEILCLTFTIKAAGEMRDDIASYAGEKAQDVAVSTIHAFAFRVLKEESLENPETCSMPGVCDEDDASETLRRIAFELGARENEGILGEKSRKRNVLFSIACELKQRRERMDRYTEDDERDYGEVYREMLEKNPELIGQMTDMGYRGDSPDLAFRRFLDSSAGTLMARYDQSLRESNLLDFEDLICRTHRLFRTQDGKTRWRERFRYIIIDEMQDTSELEYDMLKNLFPGNHVMMCGDFFQTIYEWRGSRPEIVLEEYIRDFHAERFMFTQNYRSTRLLTRATFGYLKKTCPRLLGQYCPPEIVTRSGVEGEPIRNVRLADEQAEAAWIYRYLKEHRPEDPLRVCLMARSNEYIRRLYTHLDAMGKRDGADDRIRFMTVEETAKFFRRAVIRDLLAFVRILVNPSDVLAAERICKTYVTGVGKETQRKIREMAPSGVNLASFMDPAAYRDGDPWEQLIRARKEGNLVIYDTETTGLDLRKDQVIQISAIRLNAQGQVVDTLDQMVIPTVPISSRAQATHGQTMEMILRRGGIPAEDALKRFLDFVRGSVLVGHNSLRFDRVILRRQILENSLPLPEIIAEYDTLPLAQQCLPKSENYKLGTLCRRFDIVNENAHDALGDITATGRVLLCLMDEYLIPGSEKRREAVEVYRRKFVNITGFLQELREQYMDRGRILEMMEAILERCRMRTKYGKETEQRTIEDFLLTIERSEIHDPFLYLQGLLEEAALSGSQMDLMAARLQRIPIITVHQAKGCEFDTVILAGADDFTFSRRSAEDERVFYVAITRAKERLVITSACRDDRNRVRGQCEMIRNIPETFVVNEGFAGAR